MNERVLRKIASNGEIRLMHTILIRKNYGTIYNIIRKYRYPKLLLSSPKKERKNKYISFSWDWTMRCSGLFGPILFKKNLCLNWNKFCICKEEQYRYVERTKAIEEKWGTTMAFATVDKTAAATPSSGTICSYFQKPGHDITACYRLHGYPDWWAQERETNYDGINSDRVQEEGLTIASRGRGRNTGFSHAHVLARNSSMPFEGMGKCSHDLGGTTAVISGNSSGTMDFLMFSSEQWKSLLNILDSQTNSDKLSGRWIVSGF